MAPLPFVVLVISNFFFFLVCMARDLPVLLIFSKGVYLSVVILTLLGQLWLYLNIL